MNTHTPVFKNPQKIPVAYETKAQETATRCIRESQIVRGCEISELRMYRVSGIMRPFWVCNYPHGTQNRFAIDGAGYNCFVPIQ